MKRYLSLIIGSALIGFSFNIFFLQYNLVPDGLYGISSLLYYYSKYSPAVFILIVNIFFLILSFVFLGRKTYKYILPSLLIPLSIFLISLISSKIELGAIENILIAIFGAYINGAGYSLIYKSGFNIGGLDIIQDIFKSSTNIKTNYIPYVIDAIILSILLFNYSLEVTVYSLIIMLITRYMTTKIKLRISSSKTFFIVTKKENEVKEYIMSELKSDLSQFKVKGGFSNANSSIIMSVIDTKDYYKLKEGIKIIDSEAFISIVDSYEVINKNLKMLSLEK